MSRLRRVGSHGKGQEHTPLQFSNMHNGGRDRSIGNLMFFLVFPVQFALPFPISL